MNEMYCSKCHKIIEDGLKYYQNGDGTVLCAECFAELVASGDIKQLE